MSLALYRKYRPGTFAEVIGQEHVTEPLAHALAGGRVHHAYLFSGPRGCGKTSCARILARSLNCAEGPTPTPCGVCESCVALAPNGPGNLDVMEIDAATHGLVNDARELREHVIFAPVSSRYRVVIVDEAHMLGPGAANALLKIIEEPPAHLKFVFATTEPEKVLATIKSRTFHYPFRLVPPRALLGRLQDICAEEGVDVDPQVLPLVVRAGAGSVRDALSVLDQLLGGAGKEGVGYERAIALLGYTDAALLDDVVDALAAGESAAVFRIVDRVVEAGHDPRRFAADLLERFRDLIVLAAVPDAAESGLIDAPDDQLTQMRGQAARFGPATLSRAADVLNTGLTEMRGATSPRLLLELLCARLLLPAADGSEAAMRSRVERLERRLAIAGAPAPAESATEPPAASGAEPRARAGRPEPRARAGRPEPTAGEGRPEPTAAATEPARPPTVDQPAAPGDGGWDAGRVRQVWPQVLEAVKARRRFAAITLSENANIAAVDGGTLTLSFTRDGARRNFVNAGSDTVLQEALREVIGVDWAVATVSAEAPRGEPSGGATPPPAAPVVEEVDEEGSAQGQGDPVGLLERELGARVIDEAD